MLRHIRRAYKDAFAGLCRTLVVVSHRTAARSHDVMNDQRLCSRIHQRDGRIPSLLPMECAQVNGTMAELSRCPCTVHLCTGLPAGKDIQVQFLDSRILDGVAHRDHLVPLVKQQGLEDGVLRKAVQTVEFIIHVQTDRMVETVLLQGHLDFTLPFGVDKEQTGNRMTGNGIQEADKALPFHQVYPAGGTPH